VTTDATVRIALDGVRKSYATETGALPVLNGITLDVADGEFLSLVGPSGCGKTTLLNVVSGCDAPDEGTVRLHPSTSDVRIGFVFQTPTLLDWRTVRENLAFALRGFGVPAADRDDRIRDALGLVELADCADQYPPALSGGMRQRVGFARAFCVRPDVLLMDEPFGSLDALTARTLRRRVLDVWRERRFTAVLVTHDVEEAVYLSDRVAVLSDRPTAVAETIPIDIDRPRDPDSERVLEYKERVLGALGVPESGSGSGSG
jgi:ABC-type nitrate/sulfonate/bicarbonate transport system ATPase subunit